MNIKFIIFMLLSTAAHAAILKPLDELNVLEVGLSKQGLTRITVKEDRILHVFGNTGDYVLEADEDQGQIFIRPLVETPVHVTVTTEAGHTQDFRFLPQDKTPEALILKEEENINHELKRQKLAQEPLTQDEVRDLVEGCQRGKIPLGYSSVSLPISLVPHSPLLTGEIRGEKLRCLTYEVHNKTNEPLTLSEPTFIKTLPLKESEIIAISMPHKTLTPGERRPVYVVANVLP